MNTRLARLGGLLVVALVLTGCNDEGASVEPAAPPPSVAPMPTPAPGGARPSVDPPSSLGQGLEIRYLDENGEPQVLQPKDFPRR